MSGGEPGSHRAAKLPPPLPEDEYHRIFSRVPRLTVEVVVASPERGVLLALRELGPCRGLWHLPGGTVRFGEPLVDAVRRVARDEFGATVTVGPLLGYIEYPSHYENGLDSPVGLAFPATITAPFELPANCAWFPEVPDSIHDEQRRFLIEHRLARARGSTAGEDHRRRR